jgi:hypothetical protein
VDIDDCTACCTDLLRKSPHNLIFLGLFTVCEGWLVGEHDWPVLPSRHLSPGAICSTYEVQEVLIAVGMTAGVVMALTVFAMQTKIDFTAWGGN